MSALVKSDGHLARSSAMRRVRSRPSTYLLARILSLVLVATGLALAFIPWVQNSTGTGRVVAYAPLERQQLIEAPVEGRIVRWHVREGSRVAAGDPVVDISDNDPLMLTRLQAERTAVESRIAAAVSRQSSIEKRVTALKASRESAINAANSRIAMAVQRELAAERAVEASLATEKVATANIARQVELESKGIASRRSLELAQLDHARALTDLDRARASLRAAESDVFAVQSDGLKVRSDGSALVEDAEANLASAKAEQANAEAELSRIDVRLARQSTQAVVAPRDGVVLRLVANQGSEQVKSGDPLAVLVPDTDARAVELWIDGNDVPLVHEGRRVRLQFEGWPAVQFGGWPSVAVGTFEGEVALVDATDDGKGKFRVLVVPTEGELWPSGAYLRQGVRANGWILMEEVPLGWELWRQFNGFPPNLSEPPTQADAKGGKKSGDTKK